MGENQEKARVKKSGDTDCPFNIFLWRSIPTIIYERIYSIPRCHIPCNVLYLWWKIAAQQIPVTWTKYYKSEKKHQGWQHDKLHFIIEKLKSFFRTHN